jgi:uncharacterized membrane-anchored protein YitT (DUF2179 family)
METTPYTKPFSLKTELFFFLYVAIGAFLAAFSIEVFLIPNNLIDGGVVGIAMIIGKLTHSSFIPYALVLLNLPFLYFAYKQIGRTFVVHFFVAIVLFALWMIFIHHFMHWSFSGDKLEVVVIGGAILGIGIGTIIRYGGCLDGTEILGLVVAKKTGLTVGNIVLGCNIVIFGTAGLVFQDWHPPILSLITYIVVVKVMDAVIVGLDETKSVMIVSTKSQEIAERIVHELGLGLTIMYGRGGFSGLEKEIIYVISERLQLAELKEIIHQVDPAAFIAIENLHEVSYGQQNPLGLKKKSYIQSLIGMWKKGAKKNTSSPT